ncbi:hypothetical protein FRC04_001510 [Tulasnella sp. 424]|nr:hypothetical protein FRC04_001510 [Tulasnella sp. 424]KAG8974575.1 hypothetical protein FRC05_007207 [Tulasnella sp. 425]
MSLFSLVVLAISASLASQSGDYGVPAAYALGIATGIFTILLISVSLIVDLFRRGAFTSYVWFEISWIGFLWVLWVATAGCYASMGSVGGCFSTAPGAASICNQYRAGEALSWLNWLITFGYLGALVTFSVISASHGQQGVWMASITEHPYFAPGGGKSRIPSVVHYPMGGVGPQYDSKTYAGGYASDPQSLSSHPSNSYGQGSTGYSGYPQV